MEAELLFRKREGLSETAFVEMVIWWVPVTCPWIFGPLQS